MEPNNGSTTSNSSLDEETLSSAMNNHDHKQQQQDSSSPNKMTIRNDNEMEVAVDAVEVELDDVHKHSKGVTFAEKTRERSDTINVDHHQSNAGFLKNMDDALKERLLEDVSNIRIVDF